MCLLGQREIWELELSAETEKREPSSPLFSMSCLPLAVPQNENLLLEVVDGCGSSTIERGQMGFQSYLTVFSMADNPVDVLSFQRPDCLGACHPKT